MQKTESQQMKNHHNWKRTVFFCLLIKIVWVGFTPRLTTAILFPMATESNSLWSEVDIRPTKDPILLSAFFFSFWFHRCGFWFFFAFPHETLLHASRNPKAQAFFVQTVSNTHASSSQNCQISCWTGRPQVGFCFTQPIKQQTTISQPKWLREFHH